MNRQSRELFRLAVLTRMQEACEAGNWGACRMAFYMYAIEFPSEAAAWFNWMPEELREQLWDYKKIRT